MSDSDRDASVLKETCLRELLAQSDRPVILAVAGDSGSGKSTYTRGVRRLLGNDMVSFVSLDGYHTEDRETRQRTGSTPLDPRVNDLDRFLSHLQAMRAGVPVEIPTYDHKSGSFGASRLIRPTPVLIVEGLHALYPDFLPFYDFTLFVDSDREVKWRWKFDRDVYERGYEPDEVRREMQRREVAYKRWIDFQKTHADTIVKVHDSELASLADQEYEGQIPDDCYHLEIILTPTDMVLPSLHMPVDLNGLTHRDALPFMLANVPSNYWGKPVNVVHIDGIMPNEAMTSLEKEIARFTGVPCSGDQTQVLNSPLSTLRFAQSVVAWPFLAKTAAILHEQMTLENRA